jgi:hypothetical protein
LNQWPETQDLLQRSIRHYGETSRLEKVEDRKKLAELQIELAEACSRGGDLRGAFAASGAAAKLLPQDGQMAYRAAARGARLLAQMQGDSALVPAEREQAAAGYRGEVIVLLRLAVENGYKEIAAFPQQEGLPSIAADPEFKALLSAHQGAGLPPSQPISGAEKAPVRFVFNYGFEPDPGQRIWIRKGDTWTETQPSGVQNDYLVTGTVIVEGNEGSELKRADGSNLRLFIPHRDTPGSKRMMMMQPPGQWRNIGKIENIE